MATAYELFKLRMNASGISVKNEQTIDAIRVVENEIENDISYCDTLSHWRTDDKVRARLYYKRFTPSSGFTQKIMTPINEKLQFGDVFFDSATNEHWICIEAYNQNDTCYTGKLALCNGWLKWQDTTGVIHEYPCQDINSSLSNSGESSSNQMTLTSTQHMLILPRDINTLMLDSPQRFILGDSPIIPKVYKVSQNDSTSYNFGKGLCRITVVQDVFNPDTDNIELGICDYKKNIGIVSDSNTYDTPTNGHSIIKGSFDYLKSGAKNGRIYTATFYDQEENELHDIVAEWEVLCEYNPTIEILDGNRIRLAISNDDAIGSTLRLKLTNVGYESEITLTIKSMYE